MLALSQDLALAQVQLMPQALEAQCLQTHDTVKSRPTLYTSAGIVLFL